MKILHIISSGGMYGAEAVILNLSRTLNQAGHSSTLGVFSNSANPNLQLHARATKEGIESHLIPCKGQIDRKVTARIRELAALTHADVVHAHGYKADVYVWLALRGSGMPFVSTCHNWIDDSRLVRIYGVLDRVVLRSYAAVVAVSEDVKQRLLRSGVKREKIHLVRNGIDLRPYDAARPSLRESILFQDAHAHATPAQDARNLLIVGLVGRLSREKGVDIFLQAAARVLREFPAAKFVVVGEGPDKAELDALIDSLKIRDSVTMLGRRDDMPSVYASLDGMVSSSRKEGLPMAILEGMASRRALVATAVGEVPKIVHDGRTGLLVPAEDVEALAEAIRKLLGSSTLRERLGISARALIEAEFSAARMTADYLDVYQAAAADTRTKN